MEADAIVAIEAAADGKYWQLAKGKVRSGEPLYGAAIIEPETDKIIAIGEGDDLLSAIAAIRPGILHYPYPVPIKGSG